VVNIGLSEARENIKVLDVASEELGSFTGQKPQVRRAKKSISNFKLRQGMPIGIRVTLRKDRMFDFLTSWSIWPSPASAISGARTECL